MVKRKLKAKLVQKENEMKEQNAKKDAINKECFVKVTRMTLCEQNNNENLNENTVDLTADTSDEDIIDLTKNEEPDFWERKTAKMKIRKPEQNTREKEEKRFMPAWKIKLIAAKKYKKPGVKVPRKFVRQFVAAKVTKLKKK